MASVAARGAATLSDEICRTILPMNMMMRIEIRDHLPAPRRALSPDREKYRGAEKDVSRLFI